MSSPEVALRMPNEELLEKIKALDIESLGLHILDELPAPVLLANSTHQIVFANRALCTMTNERPRALIGFRPGEVLACENSRLAEGGCGCADACSTCGALEALLFGLRGVERSGECRISRQGEEGFEALDLQVSARPLNYRGEQYVLLHLSDISAEKRRRNLETIFFHDVLNVAGSIRGFADILLDYDLKNPREVLVQLQEAACQIIDEVEAQRLLSRAESGDLHVEREPLESQQVLERAAMLLKAHEVAIDRQVVIAPDSQRTIFMSDATLLTRSLVNLTKNALEASSAGQTVTLTCRQDATSIHFEVHNSAVIPHEVQLQIFQRSFSTRGGNRGVGTYSVRLLVERYLAGQVTFVSDESSGTRFTITLPLQ